MNEPITIGAMPFVYDDGGRSKYFQAEKVGDCVVRSIAVAAEMDYKEVYEDLFERNRAHYAERDAKYHKRTPAPTRSPRDGVRRAVYEPYLFSLGFTWLPLMHVGEGCKVHLVAHELTPYSNHFIARLSKHLCAVVYGVVRDTHDPSRDGTRCVYGVYER